MRGVFAGGDAANGPDLVIHAVAAGRRLRLTTIREFLLNFFFIAATIRKHSDLELLDLLKS